MKGWFRSLGTLQAAVGALVLLTACPGVQPATGMRPKPVNPQQTRPQPPGGQPDLPDTPDLPPGTPPGPTPETPPVEPGVPADPARAGLLGTVAAPAALISNNGGSIISNNGGAILSNNGSSIISNNGGAILSNNGGGLISNNGGSYRLLAAAGPEGLLKGAFLYLTNRDEKFFFDRLTQRPFATLSDDEGAYAFPLEDGNGFPTGKDVIVNAVVNGNLRLTGYMVPTTAGSELKVNLATTLATELLRGEAYRAGQSLGAYDRAKFEQAVDLTDEAITKGDIEAVRELTASGTTVKVGTFDLRIDHVHDLRNQYVIAMSAVDKANALMKSLSDAWKQILGHRPTAVTTVAGNGQLPASVAPGPGAPSVEGDGGALKAAPLGFVTGVAVSKRGDVFVAAYTEAANSGHIRWIKPDGTISTIWLPDYPLAQPYGLAIEVEPTADTVGKLLVTDLRYDAVYRVAVVDEPLVDGEDRPVHPMRIVAGEATPVYENPFYDPFAPFLVDGSMPLSTSSPARSRWRLADEGPRVYQVGSAGNPEWPEALPTVEAGDPVPNPARYAHLNRPVGVAVDELGNIYISELGNHRVRMIVHPDQDGENFFGYGQPEDADEDGAPETFGAATPMAGGAIYTIAGNPAWDIVKTPDDGAGRWFGAYGGDGERAQAARLDQPAGLAFHDGHLYVADFDNQRIRKISRATGIITTYAGAPSGGQRGSGTDYDYAPGYGGDGGAANAAKLAFPRSITFDAAGRGYIADSVNGRIRMVDTAGKIHSIAGRYHDPAALPTDNVTDGEALYWADLYDTQYLAVDPAGNVLLTDSRHRRLRKVWRQWE
ncbi:MAG: hypothetical protein ACLGIN_01110 [Candidatus Sericytochromatia bacterium]